MSDRRSEEIVDKVRERYGKIASGAMPGCCGPSTSQDASGCSPARSTTLQIGYRAEDLAAVPEAADLGVGCGAPIGALAPAPGETILDLGSGAGLDALLAARRVGPSGKVIGVDMTPEMLERARANAAEAGAAQVEFRQGRLEALPVADASVDAVTSNCVINLVPDKAAVFREVVRVLRPGGRLVVSDIILDAPLPDVVAQDLLAYVGCVAGAIPRRDYLALVEAAGLSEITILRDIDYLSDAGYSLPEELVEKMARDGVHPGDLAGTVRSVTFRAFKRPKPAAAR